SVMLDSAMEREANPVPAMRSDTRITVYPNRARFEAALRSLLCHEHGSCAMLHVAVVGHAGTGSISRRMLNLVGSTLRVCMRAGEVAYLGDAEFAVLLHGVDAREAAAYARTVITIVSSFRVMWEGELLGAEAHIGGVMFGDGEVNTGLLSLAEDASQVAADKLGCKLHLLQDPREAAPLSPALPQALSQDLR
ncbi:MAG TPA: GGDEF domain-containing protein, partial [Gammaproteobacteria bacterium]